MTGACDDFRGCRSASQIAAMRLLEPSFRRLENKLGVLTAGRDWEGAVEIRCALNGVARPPAASASALACVGSAARKIDVGAVAENGM